MSNPSLESQEKTLLQSPSKEMSRSPSRGTSRGTSRLRTGTPAPPIEIRPLTAEEKKDAMLGRASNGVAPVFFREEFCGFCGIEHLNPKFLDMYGNCKSCGCILREPDSLRRRYVGVDQTTPLEILFATYGDQKEPLNAIDVTEKCREKIFEFWKHDRLGFKAKHKLNEIFGTDPSPGNNKQLRIRYRINQVHGMVVLDVLPENQFPVATLLIAPKTRYLRINRGTYGHPKGMAATGRMSYDVTEAVQGFVDLNGGSFLDLSCKRSLVQLFGDPCPGYPKDLRIEYEVCGRSGVIWADESRNHLKRKVYLEESPTVTPLIYIVSATYGITPTGRREILIQLDRQLAKIQSIEHKLAQGVPLTPEENQLLRKKKTYLEEKHIFQTQPINFIDVSRKMQQLADLGETKFLLDKNTFDCNATFGNPAKGIKKLLEVSILCQGHDSERRTDSKEMTDSGHPRTFITNKSDRQVIIVNDEDSGFGRLSESYYFETQYSAPIILITRATYGNFQDTTKLVDVTMEVQTKVVGRVLAIERTDNLLELFSKDPCPGTRKQLKIEYTTRGIVGCLRVRERDDLLVAAVRLGYPPVPEIDEACL